MLPHRCSDTTEYTRSNVLCLVSSIINIPMFLQAVCVSSMNGNIRHTDTYTDTPELGQPQILNQGPFCGLSLGPDSSARLNGLKMPILTMVMGQGPQLLLPYEDEHMKLVFLSSLLVAYPIIGKSTCKPCLSGVGCACMYKRGHRRCSDKTVMIPNSNNKVLSRIGCLGCSLDDHQRPGSPRCKRRHWTHQDPQGEQAWTLKTRSLFYSLLFIGV